MRLIFNKWIPFGAMNILGLVFSRKPAEEITLVTKRHEQTHTFQQYEILGVSALVSARMPCYSQYMCWAS